MGGGRPQAERVSELEYGEAAPVAGAVREQRVVEHQRPFYSKLEDLYSHFKVGASVPLEEKYAQYMDR